MPFSSGTFTPVYNWTTESAAAPIEIAKLDGQDADMATGLSNCILRDGTGLPTATIPFNSQRISGLGDATGATDALNRQTADARYLPGGSLATDRLLGRDTAGTGAPEALTVGGGLEFTGSGGIQRSALTGDVTASAGSGTTTIANDAVTYAKMQNVSATSRVLGRVTAGAGDVEELTPANLLTFIVTVDGAGSGLDADLLDGQSGSYYQSASNLNAGTIPDARVGSSSVTQHQASIVIATSQVTSGTFADGRIAASNVTQHQSSLSLAGSQISSGTVPSARITAVDASATVNSQNIGYRDVPRRTSGFARGECLAISAGVTLNTSEMSAGYTLSLYNDSGSNVTITQGAGVTLRTAGTSTTGNITLLARGIITIWCNSGTEAIASGNIG